MSFPFRISLVFLTILAGLLLAWGVVQAAPAAQATPPALSTTPMPLPDQPAVESPDISFIDSPTAACARARTEANVCYMTWSYLYAYADPNYMITMTVEIDGKARARYQGFFQTSMYVPSEMLAFRVACGAPGSGGFPNLGMNHSYTLRARDSAGLGAANYGSVTCPADIPLHIYFPLMRK
jgi:hypothetical protein